MDTVSTPKKVLLGEIAEYLNGKAFKQSDWSEVGIPIVRIQNLTDPSKPHNYFNGEVEQRYAINNGELLIAWSATLGSFIWDRGPAVLNQHIFKVVPNESLVDKEFLHYLVLHKLDEIKNQAHGLAMKHITKKKFESIQVLLPSIEEQKKIVSKISECMQRVDEIALLRQQSQKEVNDLPSTILAQIDNETSFKKANIGDCIERSRNGKSIKQDNENSTGYVLSLAAVHDVSLNISARKPIVLANNIAEKYKINVGDVFVSRSNTAELVGLASVAKESPEITIYPDLLIKLEVKKEIIRPRFLAYALRTPQSRKQIKDRAVGTSQSMVKISGERLKQIEIPIPKLSDQDAIIERFDELQAYSSDLLKNFTFLNIPDLKQSILHSAFTGEF